MYVQFKRIIWYLGVYQAHKRKPMLKENLLDEVKINSSDLASNGIDVAQYGSSSGHLQRQYWLLELHKIPTSYQKAQASSLDPSPPNTTANFCCNFYIYFG